MTGLGNHSEYGVLREVVVGSAANLHLPPYGNDLLHYPGPLRDALLANGAGPLDVAHHFPDLYAETVRQIDAIAATFEAHGVRVHRPRPYHQAETRYLDSLQPGWSQLYPADPVFMLGEHFLELSLRRAYRRKEVFPLRELVAPMLAGQAGLHHVAMPQSAPFTPSGEGPGPFLEGGDILIVGRDVIVGQGQLCSDRAGLDWLSSYLADWNYRVHPLAIRGPILHALGLICLLREGLAMAHLPALADGLPAPIADWDVIEISEEEMHGHATVGVSLDDKRYMIDPRFTRLMGELEKHAIEPVPTPCDAIGFWGGAIRCVTLPLARDPA